MKILTNDYVNIGLDLVADLGKIFIGYQKCHGPKVDKWQQLHQFSNSKSNSPTNQWSIL